MLEKPKRPKKINNQDNKQPQTIQDLIRRYDLENTKVYDFLDELVISLNVGENNSYSLEEQRIGKWIDGKTLYRKIINFESLPNTTEKSLEHNILDIGKIINIYGFSTNNDGVTVPLPFVSTTTSISLYCDKTKIYIKTTSNRTNYTTTYIFIEYTRTSN